MGIFQGNSGTSPNASTFTSDIDSATRLATSAPFAAYLTEEIFQKSAFIQSGVVQLDSRLNNITGTRVELPFFNSFSPTEEIVASSATWGSNSAGYYTTQKTTAATQYGTITTRGFAVSADDLSQVQTGEDALANIRGQLSAAINKLNTSKLTSMLTGIVGPSGPLAATNAVGKAATTGTLAETNYLSAANVTEAKYKLGEKASDVTTIAVPPKVAAYLEQVGMLTFSTSALAAAGAVTWGAGGVAVDNTQVGKFAGLNVIVDEQLPIRGTSGQHEQFVCYLMGAGVIRTGSQFPLLIETERNILALQNNMAVTYNNIMHVIGTTWSSSSDGPTNAALATASNWGAAFSEKRNIPIVELVGNSPFGGTVA